MLSLKRAVVGIAALAAVAGGVFIGSRAGDKGARDAVATAEVASSGLVAKGIASPEPIRVARAHGVAKLVRRGQVIGVYEGWNVKPTAGIDFTISQTYGTSAQANGLNYIALSNDTLTETTASTTLSNEITANGLGRAQGTYAHTNGTGTVTISHTFTCSTGAQAVQKLALFSAATNGTMHHALAFTRGQVSMQVGDQLVVTVTITIS